MVNNTFLTPFLTPLEKVQKVLKPQVRGVRQGSDTSDDPKRLPTPPIGGWAAGFLTPLENKPATNLRVAP